MTSKILSVRLPLDHWIWDEKDKNKIIKEALEFYKQFQGDVKAIRNAIEEIDKKLTEIYTGQVSVRIDQDTADTVDQNGDTGPDPRLLAALDELLDM